MQSSDGGAALTFGDSMRTLAIYTDAGHCRGLVSVMAGGEELRFEEENATTSSFGSACLDLDIVSLDSTATVASPSETQSLLLPCKFDIK